MSSRLLAWSRQLPARLPAALPSSCALCGATGSEALCTGCHRQFFSQRPHRCMQCASPLPHVPVETAPICGDCLQRPPAFAATITAADYTPPVDQLVLALKFGSRLAMAPLFARMLHDAVSLARPALALPALLTAVPLGDQRLQERGFNQALEIAKPLARVLDVPLAPTLIQRVRDTHAQAQLPPDERHKNIRGAFVVPADAIERVRGRHVGVVDDVMTTGETLSEVAATLKRFGAARVTNFVFARTPPK